MTLETTVFLGILPDSGDTPIEYLARQWRALADALCTSEGVCGDTDFQVVQRQEGANASVDILGGLAIVASDATALPRQGKYVQPNSDKANFDGIPAPPSSGTREHLLYLQINDKQSDPAATQYDPAFLILQDTGTGIPLTSLPKNAIPLAGITRRAGQTSVLTADIRDLRPFATGLDASPYTSKTTPAVAKATIHTETASDGSFTWTHGLGRKPLYGQVTVAKYEVVGNSIPTSATIELTTATTTTVKGRVFGQGSGAAFGLHASRLCWLSIEVS